MPEFNRYNRQIKLPEMGKAGQDKLQKASVLIVGIGGLGCPSAQYLAAAGIGHLGLLDHDVVDETNLHRQILFKEADIGKSKSEAARTVLTEMNSQIEITSHHKLLDADNALTLFEQYDLILDATDNFQTKYLINDACILLGLPFVSASIYKYQGQLSVFNYQEGPSYRCLYPNFPKKDDKNCEETGVLGVLPGVLGTLQATEAIKVITGIGSVLSGKLKLVDLLTMSDQLISFERNPSQVDLVKSRPLRMEMIGCVFGTPDRLYLDVREPFEQPQPESERILKIPFSQLLMHLDEIPRDEQVSVFCQTGIRSKKAIELLKANHGFDNLVDVAGGIKTIIK